MRDGPSVLPCVDGVMTIERLRVMAALGSSVVLHSDQARQLIQDLRRHEAAAAVPPQDTDRPQDAARSLLSGAAWFLQGLLVGITVAVLVLP
ncbi:hypothetical protein ACEYYA_00835 [Paracoccus sp. p3-h83]|uniref:hypothetical protein n=1 Tax=Paracoccus sp. p3-h83 TaxID=3342805 RepID=UPI0035B9E5AA